MNTKEKIIEILNGAESAVFWDGSDQGFIEKIANHLIAHGVTVQECGRWLYHNGRRSCSNCKDGRRTYVLDNYCPNCGAKMDGERKDNG